MVGPMQYNLTEAIGTVKIYFLMGACFTILRCSHSSPGTNVSIAFAHALYASVLLYRTLKNAVHNTLHCMRTYIHMCNEINFGGAKYLSNYHRMN